MQIQRHAQIGCRRQQRREVRVIEEPAVDKPVDHGAAKTESSHRSLQFGRRSLRIAHRQRGESGEPMRMCRNDFGQIVVGLTNHIHGLSCRQRFGAGHRVGQHLHVDARGVHVGEAACAKVFQLVLDSGQLRMLAQVGQRFGRLQTGMGVVLFNGDDPLSTPSDCLIPYPGRVCGFQGGGFPPARLHKRGAARGAGRQHPGSHQRAVPVPEGQHWHGDTGKVRRLRGGLGPTGSRGSAASCRFPSAERR